MLDKIRKIKNNKLLIPLALMLGMIIYYIIINIVLLNCWISAKFIDTAPLYFSIISLLILIVSLIVFGIKKKLSGFELFTFLEIIVVLLLISTVYLFSQGKAGGFAYKNTFYDFTFFRLCLETKVVDSSKSFHFIMEHSPESYKYIRTINLCAITIFVIFTHLLGTLLFTNIKIKRKSKKTLEQPEENQSMLVQNNELKEDDSSECTAEVTPHSEDTSEVISLDIKSEGIND